ncbi:MAG: KilA-N domain-containing protein [Epsilonproteobacteria bacterium]|nr:MAG: KilA-N domain-containing protein [Campylobacterota bacterium]
MAKIKVLEQDITIIQQNKEDYISLTDIANSKDGEQRAADIIKNWIRNRGTLEFIGTWEKMYNFDFKVVEFDHFKMSAGLPSFVLSPGKWIEKTNAKGLIVKAGRYGGTYVHKDIAFEFASAINPVFKLYLIKEFQRLKEEELRQLGWDIKRNLTKINYRIHTNAIKENLIPKSLIPQQISFIYASEADVLNVALFGTTAKQWRDNNPKNKGNIRDEANVYQLVCLANLESLNAHLVSEGMSQSTRIVKLNQVAISQIQILLKDKNIKKLDLIGSD